MSGHRAGRTARPRQGTRRTQAGFADQSARGPESRCGHCCAALGTPFRLSERRSFCSPGEVGARASAAPRRPQPPSPALGRPSPVPCLLYWASAPQRAGLSVRPSGRAPRSWPAGRRYVPGRGRGPCAALSDPESPLSPRSRLRVSVGFVTGPLLPSARAVNDLEKCPSPESI